MSNSRSLNGSYSRSTSATPSDTHTNFRDNPSDDGTSGNWFLDSLRKLFNWSDEKDSNGTTNYEKLWRTWLASIGAIGVGSAVKSSSNSSTSENDALLKSLYGDAYQGQSANANNSSALWNGIKFLFGNGSQSFQLGDIASSLLGIGSQFANSTLNYQNQVKLIDKQNEYNTPANQMQRFKDAGLNPNLIYGLGSNGNQPASGSVAPVDFDTSQRENRLARMQIQTQSALAKADIASKMADVRLKDKQGLNVDESTAAQRLANDTYLEGFKNQQNLLIAQYEKLIEEKREAMANADTAEARAMYANDIARLEKDIQEAQKTTAETIAKYAEANEITSAIGNIFGLNLGFGFNFSRSRTGLLPKPYK